MRSAKVSLRQCFHYSNCHRSPRFLFDQIYTSIRWAYYKFLITLQLKSSCTKPVISKLVLGASSSIIQWGTNNKIYLFNVYRITMYQLNKTINFTNLSIKSSLKTYYILQNKHIHYYFTMIYL